MSASDDSGHVTAPNSNGSAPSAPAPSPDVQAVCRWLPRELPSGAFSGRHDRVHVEDRHGLTNLWNTESVVHIGTYVGPPRGGLTPGPAPNYSVAMPAGGYLHIKDGHLTAWRDEPGPAPLIRADGEDFVPEAHSTVRPYFLQQYQNMTADDARMALLGVRRKRVGAAGEHPEQSANKASDPRDDTEIQTQSLLKVIQLAGSPMTCACQQDPPLADEEVWPYRHAAGVPTSLLQHPGAMATLAGAGNPDDAVDIIWRLNERLANPTQAGLIKAAESAARKLETTITGLPDAPLTEEAVVMVASQAVRWHGSQVVPRLPFWILGWIFLADPVMAALKTNRLGASHLDRALEHADRIRVDRTQQVWSAVNEAATALAKAAAIANRNHESLDGQSPSGPATASDEIVDLRAWQAAAESPSDAEPDPFPHPRPPAATDAYSQDIATVLARFVDPA